MPKSSASKKVEHTALYRKYRPSDFSEVRGQEQVVKVLEGAIKSKKIPHALLFAGSRGTGKTSVARIFAERIGAKEIDTYEIDAASNRGIDDVRELKDAVYTLPYESPVKVYIIDEVHMLTKEAFNALLKTLEEPPAHVIFILATTEYDKLLDTITSRCQIFQFKAPSREILRDTILAVAGSEKFKLTTDAAELIAIAADGSFRDALGITQKVIMASSDTKADADEVALIVGAPKGERITELLSALHKKDAEGALKSIQRTVESNTDMQLFLKLLLERIRAVLLLRHLPNEESELLSPFPESEHSMLLEYAKEKTSPINSHLLLKFLECADLMRHSHLPGLPLELVVMEMSKTDS